MDVIEMDAASESGVEQVREVIVQASEYMPTTARYKVYIIDEVHDLSSKAFDALLKTIEEPPPHVIFILATTEATKVPTTIRSRCQNHLFRRGTIGELAARLKFVADSEGADIEPGAITALARMADGGFRDALTLLEQALLIGEGKVTTEQVYEQLGLINDVLADTLLNQIRDVDVPGILSSIDDITRMGRDPRSILESLQYRVSDLTRSFYGVEQDTSDSAANAATRAAATGFGKEYLLHIRTHLAGVHQSLAGMTLPRIWVESEFIRIGMEFQKPPQQAVVVAPAQQKVEAPATKLTPKPEQTATVATKPVANPAEASVSTLPAPEPTGDPELDKFRKLWHGVLSQLPEGTPMHTRLYTSRVSKFTSEALYIEVSRKNDVEWLDETGKKRKQHIEKLVKDSAGQDYQLIFHVGESAPT